MKGVELPINILVIIAVAVIVLLGIIALYFSGFMGPASLMNQNAALNAGCKSVMSNINGCQSAIPANVLFDGTYMGIGKFDANGDGQVTAADTLQALCEKYYGVTAGDASGCRKECGCSG